jgi:predicted lipoprotein with Yx(FWY)xxD motif
MTAYAFAASPTTLSTDIG